MRVIKYPKRKKWPELLQRPVMNTITLEKTVKKILSKVKEKGDKAVRKYNEQFDGVNDKDFLVSEMEIREAEKSIPGGLKTAIQQAKKNIEKFHSAQLHFYQVIETQPGIECWIKNVAIEKIGLYIPGGTAPLFSTILMLGIPAAIAGCKEIVLCTPPVAGKSSGIGHNIILYTAHIAGITKIFKVGGAQAIAAMAYGTKSIPAVHKIFGPGNQFVTCAKQLVQREGIAIDMPAGPSELAVYADKTANPAFLASDLLSQAEHGKDSQVVLVTHSLPMIKAVEREIRDQLKALPRKEIAAKALKNSKIFLVNDEKEAMDLLNEYAPEHLIVACSNPETFSEKIINAGSVFLGHFSPESAGDYATGTNHTLPTNGYAKAYSGLNVDSFIRKITFQKLSEEGLRNIAETVEQMAEAEGMQAHKNAIRVRINSK